MKKAEILAALTQEVDRKIDYFQHLIADKRSSNSETKSSMGDKYETGREMLQQEINNLQGQLAQLEKQKKALSQVSAKSCSKVENGALISILNRKFLISIAFGELTIEAEKIFCISPQSPLAIAAHAKKKGESFILNGQEQNISEIE